MSVPHLGWSVVWNNKECLKNHLRFPQLCWVLHKMSLIRMQFSLPNPIKNLRPMGMARGWMATDTNVQKFFFTVYAIGPIRLLALPSYRSLTNQILIFAILDWIFSLNFNSMQAAFSPCLLYYYVCACSVHCTVGFQSLPEVLLERDLIAWIRSVNKWQISQGHIHASN